jgi:hypothetical protein
MQSLSSSLILLNILSMCCQDTVKWNDMFQKYSEYFVITVLVILFPLTKCHDRICV